MSREKEILEALLPIVFGDEHNQEGIVGILEHDEHGLGANCDKNACSKCRMSALWDEYPEIKKIMTENDLWERYGG